MTKITTSLILTIFVLLNLSLTNNQEIDKYFLGLPYRKANDKQIDFIKSCKTFIPTSNMNILPMLFFHSKYSDYKAIDIDCDSISVIITTSIYSTMNKKSYTVEDTKVMYYYNNRDLQTLKFKKFEKQLLDKKYRTAYTTIGDDTNRPEDRMKGVEFMLTKREFPKITLLQTTQDNYYEVRLEYCKTKK